MGPPIDFKGKSTGLDAEQLLMLQVVLNAKFTLPQLGHVQSPSFRGPSVRGRFGPEFRLSPCTILNRKMRKGRDTGEVGSGGRI